MSYGTDVGAGMQAGGLVVSVSAAFAGAGASLLGVVTAACCAGPVLAPLVVAVLGASGAAWAAGLKPYAPLMLAGSLVLVLVGVWIAFRRRECADGTCRRSPRPLRALVIVAAVVWLVSAATSLWTIL